MKTPEQIREWLQAQEWYPQFVENLENEPEDDREHILSGKAGLETILGAFMWYPTPEGNDFWESIDRQFQEWHNSEEK